MTTVDEHNLREQICEIGRRLYARGYAAANEGNLSCRLSPDEVLCTPTLICKGFMEPDDLCVVDLDGRQRRGQRPATSEIRLHIEVYRGNVEASAVVHCHPPHATAFAVSGQEIPTGIHPEAEVFLGVVPTAPYETPGTWDFAATIRPFLRTANTVVLRNHGTVSWSATLERAYWQTEILDSYCRLLILARQAGNVARLPPAKVEALLELRAQFGMPPDARRGGGAGLYVNPEFGRSASGDPPTQG